MKELVLSKDFASVYVTLLWVVFWAAVLFIFRRHLSLIVEAVIARIQKGSKLSVGPVSIGEPPPEIERGQVGTVAVSDSSRTGLVKGNQVSTQLDQDYLALNDSGYFLLHAVEVVRDRTTPRSGRYRVRVWVESYHDPALKDVARVTYRVWDDFERPVRATESRDTCFDLWLYIYGEFPVLACVERMNGPALFIMRYIDLPGRPPD